MPRICESYAGLEAVQAGVVEADVAEQMSGELGVRVVAAAFLDESDRLHVERRDPPRLIGGDLAAHVREGLPPIETPGDRLAFLVAAVPERLAQLRRRRGGIVDLGRDRVDGIRVDARRERAAAPIDDVAALGGDRNRPHLLPLGARDQIGVLENLEVDQAGLDAGRPEAEHRDGDGHPPGHRLAPVDEGAAIT